MLPQIKPEFHLKKHYAEFLKALKSHQFSGDVHTDYATCLSVACDNSIFQLIPQAVLFPRTTEDIIVAMSLASEKRFREVQFCPRGGGTSTNGQSLTAGIIIDFSRYMRAILEINLEEHWVRVQPGIVLDELNNFLKEYQYCFAPEISPSNRATIGGMINTDACGMGSKLIGRTSDHVEALTCVIPTGRVIESSHAIYENTELYERLLALIEPHEALIEEKFTSAPRTLCGYNLKKIPQSLNYLFCGSEGTLAVITECKLKITPIPKYKKLLVLKYHSFDDALRAVELTDEFKPLAVEAIDERLVELARGDSLYFHIQSFIDGEAQPTGAVNLVEFVSDKDFELERLVAEFCKAVEKNKSQPGHAFGYYIAKDEKEAKLLWELRKKSVGLISKKMQGTRRPIPFIEDTAVPPEHLADYIAEFRGLLDRHHLIYGMYGHVDAGCVHVRPALDMKLEADEHLMNVLTAEVAALVEKYHGVLWGEHGHGFRSEYSERFFGKELYHVVREIKTLFDPFNQLNPGKIAPPLKIHENISEFKPTLRAAFDKQITENSQLEYASAIACNGNGACFNYSTAEVMCPSYKVTRNRVQSPKGRATVMREWLRQMSLKHYKLDILKKSSFFSLKKPSKKDFSHEVYSAMSGCLGCKGCTSQCPLNVDVPEFKSKFLALYHQRYKRPRRDYWIAAMEKLIPLQAKMPRLTNFILNKKWVQKFIAKWLKLTDTPLIAKKSLKHELEKRKAPKLVPDNLKSLTEEEKKRSVILLQDVLTSFYEPELVVTLYDLLTSLGFTVYVEAYFPSGKPLHVKGFLKEFQKLVEKNYKHLEVLSNLGIAMIGLDPSITLTYRDEYHKAVPKLPAVKVQLIQEWLVQLLPVLPELEPGLAVSYYLLSHCTEKTMSVDAEKNWQAIFAHFGLKLTPLSAGCCGMSGSYGHESEHVLNSKQLFEMDWYPHLNEHEHFVLATGYSCRSQAKRMKRISTPHPIEILARKVSRNLSTSTQ